MTATDREGTFGAALRVGEFDALLGTSLISIMGDSAAYLAVTVLVYQRTGSSLLAALTFAVAFLPYLFGGTLLSALVDRLRPKTLLVGVDLAGAALIGVTVLPGVPIPVLYVALFVIGSLAPVRSGTAGALVAEVLPGDTFLAGRSLLRIGSQTGQIAGTGAGGGLIAALGPRGALTADVASFLISAAVTAALVHARPRTALAATGQPPQSLVADSLAGIRQVWSYPIIRRLLLLGWVVPFVVVAPEGLAAPAVAQLGAAPALVGLWLAASPVGNVLGSLLMVWLVPPRLRQRTIWPLAVLEVTLLILFVLNPSLGICVALVTLSGVASGYSLGLDQAIRDATPVSLRARMYAVNSTGLMVTQGLGFALAGAVGQALPAHDVVACAGGVGLVAVLALARPLRAQTAAGTGPEETDPIPADVTPKSSAEQELSVRVEGTDDGQAHRPGSQVGRQ
jgi:predicted MFS family arabinose efflux permease